MAQQGSKRQDLEVSEIAELDAMLNSSIEAAGLDPATDSVADLIAWIQLSRQREICIAKLTADVADLVDTLREIKAAAGLTGDQFGYDSLIEWIRERRAERQNKGPKV